MKAGLDALCEYPKQVELLKKSRLGVLAHPASVNRQMEFIGNVLQKLGIKASIWFGPEHGFSGVAQDMIPVGDSIDAITYQKIVSLYGDAFEDLIPKSEHLSEMDVLLIDLADVGSRYYTFIWSALLCLRAANQAGVHTMVLDRPNPIGGNLETVEGRYQDSGFLSFVGLEQIPIRHSLTLGELIHLFAKKEGIEQLSVIPVQNWDRNQYADKWDRDFVLTSPNMPHLQTAIVYPGGCLIEGTNISEGRGTTRPFEIFGAPWIDGNQLSRAAETLKLDGCSLRPLVFQPIFHKYSKESCGGVQVHVTNREIFRPVKTYVALIALIHHLYPKQFQFRTERYEYVDHIPAFDLLTGSSFARLEILKGTEPIRIAEAVSSVDPSWKEIWQKSIS